MGTKLLENILEHPRCSKGWILDGYPQNVEQAQSMARLYLYPTALIVLEAALDTTLERSKFAVVEKESGIPYNTKTNTPPITAKTEPVLYSLDHIKMQSFQFTSCIDGILHVFKSVSPIRRVNALQNALKSKYDALQAAKNEPNRKCIHSPLKFLALKLLIIGLPAIGKGTQCELIKSRYDVVHLSTGDILRAAVSEKTAIGLKAQPFMNNGLLVPDELMLGMLHERINKPDCKTKGFLLDGFPRSVKQAEFLVQHSILPDAVILLEAPDAVVIDRISGRRTDPVTKNVYHIMYNPPPADIAEQVVARWVQRDDDTEDKIKVRIATYHANLQGILANFPNMVHKIDGNQNKERVSAAVVATLDNVCKTILYQ